MLCFCFFAMLFGPNCTCHRRSAGTKCSYRGSRASQPRRPASSPSIRWNFMVRGEGSNSNDLEGGFFLSATQSTSPCSLSRIQMTSQIGNIKSNSPETQAVINLRAVWEVLRSTHFLGAVFLCILCFNTVAAWRRSQ